MDDFRKNKVGFIFQNYNIIESYTVLQNVMLPYELKGIPTKEAKKKALAIIDEVGLHDKINNRGAELSGGQKQRCVIARALAFEPEILACDEPTGNLDSETGAEIMKLIAKIAHDKLVLVVTHNYEEVEPYATRKLTIVDGSLYEDKILREVPYDDEKEVLNLDYDYLVFDYGVAGENGFNKISFLEKEQQIFVVGSKPGGEFEKTYDVIKNNFYNNVFYIYNFVAEGEQEDIKELMGEKAGVTFFAAEARDPFVFSGDMKTYGSILSLEEEKDRESKPAKKKKRLFGKRR